MVPTILLPMAALITIIWLVEEVQRANQKALSTGFLGCHGNWKVKRKVLSVRASKTDFKSHLPFCLFSVTHWENKRCKGTFGKDKLVNCIPVGTKLQLSYYFYSSELTVSNFMQMEDNTKYLGQTMTLCFTRCEKFWLSRALKAFRRTAINDLSLDLERLTTIDSQ